jgi:hypothetical protein
LFGIKTVGFRIFLSGGTGSRDEQKQEKWKQDARFQGTVLLTAEYYACKSSLSMLINALIVHLDFSGFQVSGYVTNQDLGWR